MELTSIQIYVIMMVIFGLIAIALSEWFVSHWKTQYESPAQLGLFRIFYAAVLFCEICQLIYAEPLIYDRVPGAIENNMSLLPVFYFWLANTLMLAIGWCTRFVTITNFALGLMVFAVSDLFEYHVDYVFTGINVLILFSPISARYSVDAWLSKRDSPPPDRIPAVYSQLIILFGIAVVYADSCFWKFPSVNWSTGIGVFAPASHPGYIWLDISPILNSSLLSRGAGFLTLVFEAAFLFLMWYRFSRKVLCVVGILLHVGILILFPIPWFGLAMLALYLLMWPRYSPDVSSAIRATPPKLTPALSINFPTLRWIVAVLLLAQFNASLSAPIPRDLMARFFSPEDSRQIGSIASTVTAKVTRPAFGIVTHPVFMDSHLQTADTQYRIVGKTDTEIWNVPVSSEDGIANPLTSGRLWVHWMFRVAPGLKDQSTRSEAQRLLQFWSMKEGKQLDGMTLTIEARPITARTTWEPNLLTNRRNQEWTTLWQIDWDDEPKWTQVDWLPQEDLFVSHPTLEATE